MIHVSMSEENCFNHLFFIFQIADIWNDKINPRQVLAGKTCAAINQYYFIVVLNRRHIATDFSEAPKVDYFKTLGGFGFLTFLPDACVGF